MPVGIIAAARRRSGGGSSLPASSSSARAIWDAETLAGADGSAVPTWVSHTGAYTATSSSGVDPILKTNIVGGLRIVRSSGTGRYTLSSSFLSGMTGTNGATALYMGRLNNGGGTALFGDYGTDASQNHYPLNTDGIIYEDFCSTVRKTTLNVRDIMRDWHFGALRSKDNLWNLWVEGASRFNTVTNTFAVNTSTTPFLWFATGSGVNADWDLPYWAIFDRYLTDVEVQEWEVFLNTRYSLAQAPVGTPDGNTTFLCRFDTTTPTDEVSGATATLVGNALTLTDKCQLVLDGSGDYITFPGGTINDEASANWTMELHTNSRGTNQGLIARAASDATAGRHVLYMNSSGGTIQWYAKFGASATVQITGTTGATAGGERHIALCRDGGTYRLYVNGVQVSSAANAGAIATSTDNLWIGNDPAFTTRYVQGLIGRVKFSNVCRYPSGTTFTPPTRFDA